MELPQLMHQWREAKATLEAIEQQISKQVMALGKTQNVDNIRASYSNGRKTLDYQGACKDVPQETLDAYTKVIPESRKVDYTALCKGEGIKAPELSKSAPKVTLKLIEEKKKITADTPFPLL